MGRGATTAHLCIDPPCQGSDFWTILPTPSFRPIAAAPSFASTPPVRWQTLPERLRFIFAAQDWSPARGLSWLTAALELLLSVMAPETPLCAPSHAARLGALRGACTPPGGGHAPSPGPQGGSRAGGSALFVCLFVCREGGRVGPCQLFASKDMKALREHHFAATAEALCERMHARFFGLVRAALTRSAWRAAQRALQSSAGRPPSTRSASPERSEDQGTWWGRRGRRWGGGEGRWDV